MIKKLLPLLLLCASIASAQTVAPLQGLGSVQFFDNSGAPLVNGVLYSYQAGTSTQQATYTDSTGSIQNANPLPFGSGARAQVWTTIGAFYKFVLCVQNDGAFCSAGDILFSVDNVPSGGSSGGGGGSPFTGIFISGSGSPATSGILRLASGDSICWRNAAGSTNLCLSKDTNNLLTWAGGSLKLPEVNAPGTLPGFDILWADNTAHRLMMENNGTTAAQVVASGVDINTSDQVTQLHFGSTAMPLSAASPPTTSLPFLFWNGTQIVGAQAPSLVIANNVTTGTTINTLTKVSGAPSTAVITATTDKTGSLGICIANCGTAGNATIQMAAQQSCVFDNATTANDYVTISSTVAGNCHDLGANYPVGLQVIGRVLSTNGAAGTYSIVLYPPEITAPVAVQGVTNKNLSGSVVLSGLTSVDSLAVTMPSTGGPWRAQVCYAYGFAGGSGVYGEAFITDATSNFANSYAFTSSGGGMYSACGWTPANTPYANGAAITFTVKIQNSGGQTISTTTPLTGQASHVAVTVLSAN